MSVRLTDKQADTLLGAYAATATIAVHITTAEISYHDNSAPNTGDRLNALERLGLVEEAGRSSHRYGRMWTLTERGACAAKAVEREYHRQQKAHIVQGGSLGDYKPRLGGEYPVKGDA